MHFFFKLQSHNKKETRNEPCTKIQYTEPVFKMPATKIDSSDDSWYFAMEMYTFFRASLKILFSFL